MSPKRNPQPPVPSLRTATIVGAFARLVLALERGRLADAGAAQRALSKLGFLVTLKPVRETKGGVR